MRGDEFSRISLQGVHRMEPNICLACNVGGRKANPERNPKKLLGMQMGDRFGREEKTHHWPSRGNSEQNGDGPHHPDAAQFRIATMQHQPGPRQREHEEAVIENRRCRFIDSADGMKTQQQCRHSHNGAHNQKRIGNAAMNGRAASDTAQEPCGRQDYKQ